MKSRTIEDAQASIHKNLEAIVTKHCQTEFKKPVAQHTQDAFDTVATEIETALSKGKELIFDSCCGTAVSTRRLAALQPDALVIGIDRSAVRLAKQYEEVIPNNALLVQAECADFWILAHKAGWRVAKHTIFYPNPYPKPKHLKRRWHAHPAYPTLLALGGEIEVRSNWMIYIDEFVEAFKYSGVKGCITGATLLDTSESFTPMTLFEKKYKESQQALYQCKIKVGE